MKLKTKIRENGYYVNQHSCFLLQYHLVLVTKYRHPVITGEIEEWLKEYLLDYFKQREMVVQALECNGDHIHILFDAPPSINLSEFVNAFKSASSRHIRKRFPEQLKPFYWKPYFWSKSYYIGTVSDKNTEVVKNYINHQKD